MQYAILNYSNNKWIYPHNSYDDDGNIKISLPHFKDKQSRKYVAKVNKLLDEAKINELLIDRELLKVRPFCNFLLDCDRYIITGRRIYRVLVYRILKELSNLMKVDIKKLKVAILLNGYSLENVELIKLIAKEVKSLTVVTTDKDYYRKVTRELYEEQGIVLKTIEKYRMNLKYANVIINVDFPGYDMDSIITSNNCLIVCGLIKYYGLKKNFDGIVIRNVDVIAKEEGTENLEKIALCEARTYNQSKKIMENDKNFEKMGYRINGFFGENGKITSEEFQRLGKILLDK